MKTLAATVVLSAALALPAFAGPAGWADPLAQCGERCEAVIDILHPADTGWLRILPPRAAETIRSIEADPALTWDEDARAALDRLEAAPFVFDPTAVRQGERQCTVYWYGFLDEGGGRVGTHRCRLEWIDGDQLSITKVTGDGLTGVFRPVESGGAIFIGRSFLPDHRERDYDPAAPLNVANQNYGNVVGIAVNDGAGLMLLTADLLGFTEPDDTYFGLLVVE
jgi:hypothetical protein